MRGSIEDETMTALVTIGRASEVHAMSGITCDARRSWNYRGPTSSARSGELGWYPEHEAGSYAERYRRESALVLMSRDWRGLAGPVKRRNPRGLHTANHEAL